MYKTTCLLTLSLLFLYGSDTEAGRRHRRSGFVCPPCLPVETVYQSPNTQSSSCILSNTASLTSTGAQICPLLDLGPHPSGVGNLYYAEFWHDGCVDPEPAFLGGSFDPPKECGETGCVRLRAPTLRDGCYLEEFAFPRGSAAEPHSELRFRVLVKFFDKEQRILRYAYLYKYRTHLHAMNPMMERKLVYPRFGFETLQTMDAREADEAVHLSKNLYHVTYDGEKFIVALSGRACP